MNIADLKPNPNNPRKISDRQQDDLLKSMAKYGDLSGIVYNIKTGNLICGHQRREQILAMGENPSLIVTKEHKKASKNGTVKEGYFEVQNERYAYREVKWNEDKEDTARILANKLGGEFDFDKLGTLYEADYLESIDLYITDDEQQEEEDDFEGIKKSIYNYSPKDFESVVTGLKKIMEDKGISNHTDAVKLLFL